MKVVALGEVVAEAQAGFASGERAADGVIQLRMNNVDTEGRFVWDRFLRVPASSTMIDEYRLRPGDVVFNNTNSTELVGKSAMFQAHAEPVVYSNHFTRLRTREEMLRPAYLAVWLNHLWQRGTFAEICNQWIGQSAVKAEKLLALEIPLPPVAEQDRIAARLTEQLAAVERARAAALTRLAAAEALPAAYLREVFEGQEASEWPQKPLGEIATLVRGKFTPRPRNDARFYGGPYPWIQIGEIGSTGKYITTFRNTLNDEGFAVSKMFPKGTLVISIAATIGAAGILTFDSCMPDSLVAVIPRQGSETEYLYHVMTVVRKHLESIAPQMAQANIKLAMLEPLLVPCPPLEVQQRVFTSLNVRISEAESVASRCREELAAIEAFPAALLRGTFNGNN